MFLPWASKPFLIDVVMTNEAEQEVADLEEALGWNLECQARLERIINGIDHQVRLWQK